MKNENLMNSSFGRLLGSDLIPDEFNNQQDFNLFCKIHDEMNKFLQNLNQSKYDSSLNDRIHLLFMALKNLDNVEKELLASNFAEELLYQEKIIEDIHSMKLMVIDYINDLSGELNRNNMNP
ncbi:MAG: hypothetical protein AMS27_02270 [Bacteroides sp. SM23_62_1]|nr:MAG: hypothetical protein AMS27_02270 [Bacteroides sp. SM23_62_1]